MTAPRNFSVTNTVEEDGVLIPGTVHLVDLEGTMDIKHAKGSKDVVLIPTPSSDPNDPLNWSRRRKLLATSCICVYTVMVGIASAAIYSVLIPISLETGLTLGDLNSGTGYMFLFFGWSCLIWQPLALQYGKRPVYLISLLGTMATQIWAPYTKTNGQWIASKILQGFFGAPIESLVEISITDLYFTHERGRYIALYGLMLAGSNFFASVIAGFIASGQGWEWVLYWCGILCAIGFVICFLLLEETNYTRTTTSKTAPESADSKTASTKLESKKEKDQPQLDQSVSSVETGHVVAITGTKSYWSKLALFQREAFSKPNQMLGMVKRPLIFLSFPVIFFSGFNYGSNLVWFNVLNGTASLILSSPPYNFGATDVGLAYLAPLIGVIIGFVYTGTFGDWLLIKLAQRNKGIMESEHRLWVLTASIIVIPGALILWGVGAAHSIHWFGLVFAMGCVAFAITIGLQASVSYCIDSYRELSGEAIITVILVRNTMSFAIGYGLTPWVENMGLQSAFITAAVVGLVQVLSFLVFVKCGKGFRKASTGRYWRYVGEMGLAGLSH